MSSPAPRPVASSLPQGLRHLEDKTATIGWRGWAGLAGAGAVIILAVIWGSVGDVPTRVTGRCILMRPEGVADVSADAAGRVSAILVRAGDQVSVGQQIALVSSPELAERIEHARSRVADLDKVLEAARAQTRRSTDFSASSLAEQLALLQQQREATLRKIALAEQQVTTNDRLREDGLITERARQNARLDLDDAKASLGDIERRIAEANKRRTDFLQRTTRDVSALALQANDARRELERLLSQSEEFTRVRTPVAGRVVEIKAAPGTLVRRDTPVIGVERMTAGQAAELEVLMFVSAADGKKIDPQAMAEIVPEVSRREEHGVLRGRVHSISDYPSTPQGLLARIANPTLMRELAQGAAPFQVRIELDRAISPRPDAVNPYDWSARAGAGVDISSGTLCQGDILVRHERPIGFVIPIFRSTLR